MKIVFVLPLLGLALFCVFGVLASAEVSDPTEQFLWRSGYAVLGLMSLLGAISLIFGSGTPTLIRNIRRSEQMKRYVLLCAVSGIGWAVIAYFISIPFGGAAFWGGVMSSPFIGVVAGLIYRPGYRFPLTGRVAMSLLTLYLSAVLFGLAWGITDALQGLPGGASRGSIEVVYQRVLSTLYGVTLTGFVVFLWPLAHLNHWLVGHLAGHDDGSGLPSRRSGSVDQEKH